jgi:hypothetical protein
VKINPTVDLKIEKIKIALIDGAMGEPATHRAPGVEAIPVLINIAVRN